MKIGLTQLTIIAVCITLIELAAIYKGINGLVLKSSFLALGGIGLQIVKIVIANIKQKRSLKHGTKNT